MAEQSRSNETPRSGIRNFMSDPKSSVMNYLAENMAAQQLQQQQQQQQSNGLNGPLQTNWHPNRIPSQFHNHGSASQSSQSLAQLDPNEGRLPSPSPQPGIPQPALSIQQQNATPYIASNLDNTASRPPGDYSGMNQQSSHESIFNHIQHHLGYGESNEVPKLNLGKAPPIPGTARKSVPHSAARLYSRMCLDFEASKAAFFKARAGKRLVKCRNTSTTNDITERNNIEMAPAAYELESLSRRIWTLRFEHASEFEGYQEWGHQVVMANWQNEYELWADTVADIQDGELMASVQSNYSAAYGAMNAISSSSTAMPPGRLASSYQDVPQPTSQGMNVVTSPQAPMQVNAMDQNGPQATVQTIDQMTPPQVPMQGQQYLNPQGSSQGQSMPEAPNVQSNRPPQNMPSTSMASILPPHDAPSSSAQIINQLPGTFPAQATSPPPSQRPAGLNAPPPGPMPMGTGPQRPQNASPSLQSQNISPNPQRSQQVPSQGQAPVQQQRPAQGQQMQAGRPAYNANQPPNAGQQPNMQPSPYPIQQQLPRPPPNGNMPPPARFQ